MSETPEQAVERIRNVRRNEALQDVESVREALRDGLEAAAWLVTKDQGADTTYVGYLTSLVVATTRLDAVEFYVENEDRDRGVDESHVRGLRELRGEGA